MNVTETAKKPNISYMTYGEIVKLALDIRYGNDDSVENVLEQLDFAEQLVIDLNSAIEDREIIPVTIEKSSSTIGNYEYYKNNMMTYLLIVFPLGSIAVTKYLWNKPDIRASVLLQDSGVDVLSMVINIFTIIAVAALVPLLPEVFKYVKIRYLSLKSYTPTGMIKYQLKEAKYRGYTDAGYFTDSVMAFLNSTYGFNFGVGEQRDSPENNNIETTSKDTPDDSGTWVSNPLFREGGLLKLVFAPRNAKLDKKFSEKMSRLANVKHASRNETKERISEIVKREIAPPCTCYHNQIARYIIKNKDVEGFEARLAYIQLDGTEKTLKDTDVMDIAKRVMKAYDPSRVYDRTISLRKCPIHKTM